MDYVCPTLFWPRWPGLPRTQEFTELAAGTQVGIYPTLSPLPAWLEEDIQQEIGPIGADDAARLTRYKQGFCQLGRQIYDEGADGISTFNWYFHLFQADVPNLWCEYYGYGQGGAAIQAQVLSVMDDPQELADYCQRPMDISVYTSR